jgi:dienelactone hydrolase
VIAACLATLVCALAPPASAAIPGSLHTPGSCTEETDGPLDYFFCDDGVPMAGGLIPNLSGGAAITVPAKYGGDGHTGLPAKAADAGTMPGANPADGTIGLDVDVSLPRSAPPSGGYPLLFFMHGCCGGNKTNWEGDSFDAGGEKWHYTNAWYASRGYVVVNYTARGFVSNQNRGSSGETQLNSRSYEVNDYQHLACQVLASASEWDDVTGQSVAINPKRIVTTGGSYGGGFSWLSITDPKWACNSETGAAGTELKLAASAPQYGWTDLAYTLVPNGLHSQSPDSLPSTDGCDTGPRDLDGDPCPGGGAPIGVAKQSILAGLYGTGTLPTGNHTTFPQPEFQNAITCLQGAYPYELNPLCDSVLADTLPEFLRERSAYYQNDFFQKIATDPSYRVPIFNAATFNDPLFPPYENRRMANRLLATVPGYPIEIIHGDYQHFVQTKAKEFGDLCGSDHHVCLNEDYPNGGSSPEDFNDKPASLVRTGVKSPLDRFLDHYAKPAANSTEPAPDFDVTANLQVCPETADALGVATDEPGPKFSAPSFEELAPNTLERSFSDPQTTLSTVPGNPHALTADPVVNQQTNSRECPVETGAAGPGVATYETDPLGRDRTMIGSTGLTVEFDLTGPAQGVQLNARLYDVLPGGEAVMADRGTRVLTVAEAQAGEVTFGLHGNGWRFHAGDRIRIELAQDDSPYVHSTTAPSSLELSGVDVAIPFRERVGGGDGGGGNGGGGGGGGGGQPDDGNPGSDADTGGADPAQSSPSTGTGDGDGSLPFTGLDLLGLLLAALALLALGRALARRRDDAASA